MKIMFDMDGTIANFYGVENWLDMLRKEETTPYEIAETMIDEATMLSLIEKGYELGIISWCAKNATKEYDKAVRKAKREWLKRNYPNIKFTEIHIVKYGTPKYKVAYEKMSILVDDEKPNRDAWKGIAIEPLEILNF